MIGEMIRKLRVNKGLSQEQLGNEIGVSGTTIRMIELNKRECSKKNLALLADFFNVSTDYLEGRESTKEISELERFIETLAMRGVNIESPDIQSLILHYVQEEIKKIQNKKAQD